eukprot:363887-Chlamydomonas_euryale.AAC.12
MALADSAPHAQVGIADPPKPATYCDKCHFCFGLDHHEVGVLFTCCKRLIPKAMYVVIEPLPCQLWTTHNEKDFQIHVPWSSGVVGGMPARLYKFSWLLQAFQVLHSPRFMWLIRQS